MARGTWLGSMVEGEFLRRYVAPILHWLRESFLVVSYEQSFNRLGLK